MKKTTIIVLFFILTICICLTSCINGKTYSSAQTECSKFLEKHQVEMEALAIEALDSKVDGSGYFKDYFYICYKDHGFVKFDIDGQGMLGGQYWSLVYADGGILYGESEQYYFEEENGNNIVCAEKLKGNWWFYWEDYDGTDKSNQ